MAKTHFHAAELAALRLPGMPVTKAAVRIKAEREGWPFVEVKGIGGTRREYAPPDSVRNAIVTATATTLVSTVMQPTVTRKVGPADQLPLIETEGQTLAADARKGVLLALNTLMNRSGYPMKKAARVILDMARKGEAGEQLVAMLKMARDGRGRPSPDGLPSERSIIRFVEYERAGMLAPKKSRDVDMTVPAWAKSFLEHYQRPEKPTVEHAYNQFLKALDDAAKVQAPSVHQVRRFLTKVGKVTLQVGRMGDREIKNIKAFVRRDFANLLPGDVYSADGHTFDAEVQHPMHGRPFRPEITTVVDIATRKAVGWSVGLAESAFAVLDALRDAALGSGIPAILYVDNGSGYKNELMTASGTGLMARLGIEMVNSLPYNSQARGVIERLHQTIWVNAAKELPGFIGRDMDRQAKLGTFKLSRKAIANGAGRAEVMPLMAWDHFIEFCNEKVAEYNDRPHRSLSKLRDPLNGRSRHLTPNEAWARAVEGGFQPHLVSDDEARPLFRPQVLRTVRRCEIELFGNKYFARALEEFHTEQLRIGYEIHDPAHVWVYDDTGRFICRADLDGNKRYYMPKSVVEQARDKRAAGRERRLEVKLVEVQLERRGAPALEMPQQVSIPGLMGSISISQLADRARQAELVEVNQIAAPAPAPTVQQAPTPADWSVPGTPAERYAEWARINGLNEEELGSERQKKWRHTYQATAEFRAFQKKTA